MLQKVWIILQIQVEFQKILMICSTFILFFNLPDLPFSYLHYTRVKIKFVLKLLENQWNYSILYTA